MKRYRSRDQLMLWNIPRVLSLSQVQTPIHVDTLAPGSTFIVLESDKDDRRILSGTSEGWVWISIDALQMLAVD